MRLPTLVCLLGCVAADNSLPDVLKPCGTNPSQSTDVYFVRDTTSNKYSKNTYANEIGNALTAFDTFYKPVFYSVAACLGFGNNVYHKVCYTEVVPGGTLQDVVKGLHAPDPVTYKSDYFLGNHVMLAVFQQVHSWWFSTKNDFRRLFIIITASRPMGELATYDKVLEHSDVMAKNCPMTIPQPGGAQFGRALQKSEAGLGVFIVENGRSAEHYQSWEAYLRQGSQTDAIVYGDLSGSGVAQDLYMLLSNLACPAWIATTSSSTDTPTKPTVVAPTSTPIATKIATTPTAQSTSTATQNSWNKKDIFYCLMTLSRCSSDPAYLQDALAECLNN